MLAYIEYYTHFKFVSHNVCMLHHAVQCEHYMKQ